jgi:ATP-dependent helicase/nuclease subunit A
MTEKPFRIYRSSAGSGKTYTLALSYLKLALAQPFAFQQILGVTFTNKATAEMKSRIISVLSALAKGEDHSMKQELMDSLGLSANDLTKRAKELLSQIIHRYSQFSVSTIDSFFHQVIRNFAREIGLQGSFTISLDQENILTQVVDQMLADVGKDENKPIRNWLTEFAGSRVEEGSGWDFRSSIYQLAGELLKEEFKGFGDQLLVLTPKDFYEVQVGLTKIKKKFESKVVQLGEEGLAIMEPYGGYDAFKSKKSGPAGMFVKAAKGEFDVSEKRLEARDNPDAWLKKEQLLKDGRLYSALQEQILPKYSELLDFIDSQLISYQSAIAASRYLYTLGILSIISRYLQAYRDENDVMLIPDLTEFLRKIIRDSDTPYIYEKIGTRYQHFLLDEFQDTSRFQWDNFRPLIQNAVASGLSSLVVGDVKQSIYRWRGGDWQLLQTQLQDDLGSFGSIERLGANYRSAHPIVRFNNQLYQDLIQVHQEFFEGLETGYTHLLDQVSGVYADIAQEPKSDHLEGKIDIRFLEKSEDWKADAIAQLIKQVEELQREGHSLSGMAVLTRKKTEGIEIADAFFEYRQSDKADPNLSYEVVSSEALLLEAHPVVGFLIAMLKWLHDEKDDILLAGWLVHYCHLTNQELPEAIRDWRPLVPKAFIKHKAYLKTLPINEMVEALIRLFELEHHQEAFAYLQGFQDAVLDFSKHEKSDIATFVEWWETTGVKRSIQVSEDNQAIRILTIHKAKGLEFAIVFIPFLSWPLDHRGGFNEEILWCRPPKKAPFDGLPVVPLKYTSDLKDTYWANDYWTERLNVYLDAINLLYVATTRPILAMYAFAPQPSEKGKINHVGEVMHRLISDSEYFDQKSGRFEQGQLPAPQESKEKITELALDHYPSFPWRGRVSLQLKSKRLEEGEIEVLNPDDPRQRGILLHELISSIRTANDLEKHKEHPLYHELESLISDENVSPYFKDIEQVRTEPSILLPGGEMKRLDRLVKKKGEWYVLDFKTGKPRSNDHKQVAGYMKVLIEMGITSPKGRLIYLEPLSVEEVEA